MSKNSPTQLVYIITQLALIIKTVVNVPFVTEIVIIFPLEIICVEAISEK